MEVSQAKTQLYSCVCMIIATLTSTGVAQICEALADIADYADDLEARFIEEIMAGPGMPDVDLTGVSERQNNSCAMSYGAIHLVWKEMAVKW